MRMTHWRWIAPLIVVLVVAGIAVSLVALRPAPAPASTTASLARTHANLNDPNPQPFSRIAHDASNVQRLYDIVRGLPPVPKGAIYYCPIDFGVTYTLTFRVQSGVTLAAQLDAGGCRFLSIGKQRYQTSDTFWTSLERTFDVTQSTDR
jgi:hypothetical protein